jgi:hypothetical protein
VGDCSPLALENAVVVVRLLASFVFTHPVHDPVGKVTALLLAVCVNPKVVEPSYPVPNAIEKDTVAPILE